MSSQTDEQALEAAIERELTGITIEELEEQGTSGSVAEQAIPYQLDNGYWLGDPADFNAEYAIDERRFWHFLRSTQPDELEKLQGRPQWKMNILNRLDRVIKRNGVVKVLRKGLKVDHAHFTLLYATPLASSPEEVKQRFKENEFSLSRQVHYSNANSQESIDLVFFVNGLPVATMELKNIWTGQSARNHGIKQYEDRDQHQPLLQFGRCVVHFAVDPDEVYMTTRLEGSETNFLPFNKGHNKGSGNPPNPFGHKTAYLWEEVLSKRSLANIIEHFVRFDGKPTTPLSERTLFFPRYHQLDVVRKLLQHVRTNGVGQRYLIQHSAGSGKSHSITWSAFQLIEAYPESRDLPGSKGKDFPLFDSVIVVTDRTVLDKQIRQHITQFSQVKNIVAPVYNAEELKEKLEDGKKIIITTIQKFPYIVEGITDLSDSRFAVVIDEAHSSQSGSLHHSLNKAMGRDIDDEDEEMDAQDLIIETMKNRKMRGNASYFAFTATPKPITLEMFGTQNNNDGFDPFHLYSMKQAIEEGFILDVLANYTTYRSYYEIAKSIEDNPLFETAKAQKKIRAHVERHSQTIQVKAEIMVDHFIKNVVNTKKLKGKAKGMVVTRNIKSAIRYFFAIRKILQDKDANFKALVAFSDSKEVDGEEYTEGKINGFAGKKIKKKFDTDGYRILVVAKKYLTGFDQPKLCTMYVDRKLQGVMAVQALSRLNRSAPELGKKTEDLFVLDFHNTTSDIKKAFDEFYTATTLNDQTDVNVLHELKGHMDMIGVYEWEEVEQFTEKYHKGLDAQKLSPIIDKAAERFNSELELDEKEKADFKIKAKQFVKVYAQMSAILPFELLEWEYLFWFLKFLIPKLVVANRNADEMDELLESVDLSTYGLERTKLSKSIELDDSESEVDPQNPNPRKVHENGDKDILDAIIEQFNERHFMGWEATPEEQRVKLISIAKHVENNPDFEEKFLDNPDQQNRDLALQKMINEAISKQRKNELEMYKKYSQDEGFKQALQHAIKRIVSQSVEL